MFKNRIGVSIILFVFLTVKQFIFNSEIGWIENIGFSVFLFLFYVFWKWARKPYDWNKGKKEK